MQKSNREIGDAYEKEIAEELGGKLVQGSGSIREKKEDVDFRGCKMQVKFTSAKSISIKAKDLAKLEEHALNAEKKPALVFAVEGGEHEWIAFPLWLVRRKEWFRDYLVHLL